MKTSPRNMVIFVITCMAIIFGYTYVENLIWPKPKTLTAQQKKDIRETVGLLAEAAPTGDGLAAPWRLAVSERLRQPEAPLQLNDLSKGQDKAKVEQKPEAKRKQPIAIVAKPKPDLIELGNEKFNLQVRLTSRGGGVDRVIVTHFEHADEWGLPDKRWKSLHLIESPEDLSPQEREQLSHDEKLPSFLLYHYAQPSEARPENELGEENWTVVARPPERDSEHQQAVFSYDLKQFGLRFIKTYVLDRNSYHIGLSIRIERIPGGVQPPPAFRYQLASGHGLPIEGKWYTTTYRNAMFGWLDNGSPRRHMDDNATVQRELGGERLIRSSTTFQYAASVVQYFASALCVDDQQENKNFIEYARTTTIDTDLVSQPLLKEKLQLRDISPRLISEELKLAENPVEHKYLLYHGPVKVRLLHQLRGDQKVDDTLVDRYERTLNLRTMTDYHSQGPIGSFASTIGWTDLTIATTNMMHWLLGFLFRIIPVPALAILILTIMVRGALFPISRRQQANMKKMQEKMQKLQPELKKLEAEYKGREQELHQAKMKFMMEHGVNPMAQLGGCLLMFAQMPVFMGLYYCLQENVFFRLQDFLWMPNLAAPDMLFRWGRISPWLEQIPYVTDLSALGGTFYLGPFFNLLPVIAVALMWMQQKLYTPPAADEQQEMQQKMFKYMMIFFGFMFYKVAAGLCLYFIASSLWGLAERKLLPKKQDADAPPETPGKGGRGGRGKGAPLPKPDPKGWLGQQREKLRDAWKRLLDAAEKK